LQALKDKLKKDNVISNNSQEVMTFANLIDLEVKIESNPKPEITI
jgi:hypothetical protein